MICGVGVGGYNGTFTITAVPSPTTFQYTIASQQANSGGGSATYYSPFKVRIGGNDSALIGGTGLPYSAANLTAAINAISGFAGTVTVTSAAATGFTTSPTPARRQASTCRTSSSSSSTAAASRPSRRRTTAARWTRSG